MPVIDVPGPRLRTQSSGPSLGRRSARPAGGHRRSDGGGHGRGRRRRRDAGLAVLACIATTPATRSRFTPAHPDRFGLIKPVDPTDPAVADTIADWAATTGHGRRPHHDERDDVSTDPADPGINRVLAAAARHSLPVNLLCWGRLEQAATAGRAQSRHAAGDRPPRAAAAVRAAAARAAVRRSAEGAGAGRPRPTSRSRSAAPARCRTSRSPTRTSGIRSGASSTRSASIAACGAPTGPARSRC